MFALLMYTLGKCWLFGSLDVAVHFRMFAVTVVKLFNRFLQW